MLRTDEKIQWAKEWLAKDKCSYINGEWKLGEGESWEAHNPATGELLGSYHFCSENDVEKAVQSAQHNHQKGHWRNLPKSERISKLRQMGQVARDYQKELATLVTLENGKLYRESLDEDLPDCSDIWDYYAGWVDKLYGETCPVEPGYLNYTVKEPVGVCALIVPWNFPLLLACWKMAPALAMGNSVVIKPSEYTSYSLIHWFEKVMETVDLPPGTLNLVLGDAKVGTQLSHHSQVNKVSFTGSTTVGKEIVKASGESNLKQVTLELGGKSPNIIFEDTPDLEAAVERSYSAMFSQKGEKCSEPTRLLVEDSIYEHVVEQLVKKANEIVCGDPFDPSSQQGAQCNKAQFDKILSYIEAGKKDGAKVVAGGDVDVTGSNSKGYFIRPTIFADVDNKISIAQEEIFGPVLVVSRFESEEQAIELANDTAYGLAAGLWTADVSRAHRVAAGLDAGMVFINRYGCYDFSSPFGGFKQSGWGKEMAKASLDSYTRSKSIWLQIEP